MKKKIRDDFLRVFVGEEISEPLVFLSAAKIVVAQAPTAERHKLEREPFRTFGKCLPE
jgi:hypothetical protein